MAPTEATARKVDTGVATIPFPRPLVGRDGTARSKIKTLDELAVLAEEAKARGRSVEIGRAHV